MATRKGLSKAFTREVITEDELSPSEFKVVPVKLSRSYADSPIEEIRKQKQMESSFVDARAAEERLRKARTPTEAVLDREKIDRVVQRINTFKKMQAEKAKQEAAAKAQEVKLVTSSAPAPRPENSPQSNKGGFIQKLNVFKKVQTKEPAEQGAAKAQDASKTVQLSAEKAPISPKNDASVKKQENNSPAGKDSETKNKKDNSVKEPSF